MATKILLRVGEKKFIVDAEVNRQNSQTAVGFKDRLPGGRVPHGNNYEPDAPTQLADKTVSKKQCPLTLKNKSCAS